MHPVTSTTPCSTTHTLLHTTNHITQHSTCCREDRSLSTLPRYVFYCGTSTTPLVTQRDREFTSTRKGQLPYKWHALSPGMPHTAPKSASSPLQPYGVGLHHAVMLQPARVSYYTVYIADIHARASVCVSQYAPPDVSGHTINN